MHRFALHHTNPALRTAATYATITIARWELILATRHAKQIGTRDVATITHADGSPLTTYNRRAPRHKIV